MPFTCHLMQVFANLNRVSLGSDEEHQLNPEKTVMVGMTLRQMSLPKVSGWRVSWSIPSHTLMLNCARRIKQVCVIRDIQLQEDWKYHPCREAVASFFLKMLQSSRICQIFASWYTMKVNLNKEIKWITYQTVQNVTLNTSMKMERSWCAQSVRMNGTSWGRRRRGVGDWRE